MKLPLPHGAAIGLNPNSRQIIPHRELRLVKNLPPGFSLVELLVVITIIAALASIAFVVGTRAKNSASQVTAIGNMKQLGCLVQVFAADNNNALMHQNRTEAGGEERLWAHHLLVLQSPDLADNSNYKKSPGDVLGRSLGIFSDPKALKQGKGSLPTEGHDSWRTFGYNNRIGYIVGDPEEPKSRNGARLVGQVTVPEKLILFTQARLQGKKYPTIAQPDDVRNGRIDFDLHDGKSLVGFFDGHVGLFSKAEYPCTGGVQPGTGTAYTDTQLNEFWLGNAKSYDGK